MSDSDVDDLDNEVDERAIQVEPIKVRPLKEDRKKLLIARGVPGQDLMTDNVGVFDAVDFLIRMEPDLPGVTNRTISAKKQMEKLRMILKNPLRRQPYTIAIGSYPSDARAKYLAHMLFSAAIDQYQRDRPRFGARGMPMWHRVWGNYKDTLRDGHKESPCMLFIANIHDESTSVKIEKVRDLLEMYSDIPRVVITGGRAPIDLFQYRLSYQLSAGFYVGPPNLIKENL